MDTRSWACWLLLLLTQQWVVTTKASVGWKYAVIIDAGSTGSRVHVYKYYTASSNNSPWATVDLPEAVHKTTPGLSSYSFDPRTAANSLKPLLKFAKEKVPENQWHSTPIQLLATAGLRMLNNSSAGAILTEVRAVLASSGFSYQGAGSARVLSGRDEGLWGWVAVNYATGALQAATTEVAPSQRQLGRKVVPAPVATAAAPMQGVLELGGASMQVTFMPKGKLVAGQAADLALPRLGSNRVYSYSFDGLGLQAVQAKWSEKLAAENVKQDPCLPSGYSAATGIRGNSDWGACKAGVKQLMPVNKTCSYLRCGIAGAFIPNVDGAVFLGLDNFYYTARMLGLPSDKRISVNQLEKAASDFCHQNWRNIRNKYFKRNKEPYALKICFSSALIISILRDGLQLDTSAPVLTASNSVQTPSGRSVEVNWALGALIVEILRLGGRPISSSTQQQLHTAVAGPYKATGEAVAAATAASFCLIMIMLSSCAAYFRVGVSTPTAAVAAKAAAATNGRVSPLSGLPTINGRVSPSNGLNSIRAAIAGVVQQGNRSGGGGVQSSVRYQRVCPASPVGNGVVPNGVRRPSSAAAGSATSVGGRSGGGITHNMNTVGPRDIESAAGYQNGRSRTSEGATIAMQQAKHQ